MTALLLIDLTELALPQPRVSRRAPSAASVRRRKAAKPLSFATSLQRADGGRRALALTAQFSPDGADAALLRKAAIVAPRDSDAVWRDERLARALEAVGDGGADAAATRCGRSPCCAATPTTRRSTRCSPTRRRPSRATRRRSARTAPPRSRGRGARCR